MRLLNRIILFEPIQIEINLNFEEKGFILNQMGVNEEERKKGKGKEILLFVFLCFCLSGEEIGRE